MHPEIQKRIRQRLGTRSAVQTHEFSDENEAYEIRAARDAYAAYADPDARVAPDAFETSDTRTAFDARVAYRVSDDDAYAAHEATSSPAELDAPCHAQDELRSIRSTRELLAPQLPSWPILLLHDGDRAVDVWILVQDPVQRREGVYRAVVQ